MLRFEQMCVTFTMLLRFAELSRRRSTNAQTIPIDLVAFSYATYVNTYYI